MKMLTALLLLALAAPSHAATYNVAAVKSGTTTLLTVDTINFSLVCGTAFITNRSATDLWVTLDGSTPTIGGDEVYVVPAGSTRHILIPDALNARQIKITASVASAYTVDVY